MLKSVGDRWEERGAEYENFEVRVPAYSADSSQSVFDVFEGSDELRHSAVVFVQLYLKRVDTCVTLSEGLFGCRPVG